MAEWQLFEPGTVPEYTTPEWYAERETAPHLEQEGHKQRLELTAKMVNESITMGAKSVCDLGAGDGGLLTLIQPPTVPRWGFDLQQSNVEAAVKRGVTVALLDIVNQPWTFGDCMVATEFLEHLIDPHGMVRRIAETGARYLVASSPYNETFDSHYGYHTWAWDQAGYRKLLEDNGWWVIRQETAWISQVLLAVRREQ